MPRTEAEEKNYRERVLPGIEAFHALHPLKWMLQEQRPSDEIKPDSILRSDPEEESTIPGKLGKEFLDRTNVWLQKPNLTPSEKLSIEGRAYVDETRWVIDKAKQKLIESKGELELEPIIIAGQPVDEYLDRIKAKIVDEQEYQYINKTIHRMINGLAKLRMKLVFYGEVGKPIKKDITEPHHRTERHWSTPR